MHELPLPMRLTSTARAKINLRLKVLGLRDDGFHEVETLLHPIDLADEVTVTVTHAATSPAGARLPDLVTVACSDPALAGPGNLAAAAARAWSALHYAQTGPRSPELRIEIAIVKHIPVAAGLGGGSADAAATLRCLQRFHPVPAADLLRAATELGSDVPFFLTGRPAVARGRGERLAGVTSVLDLPLLLAVPSFGVAARDAYRWWDEDGEHGHVGHDPLADLAGGTPVDARLLAEEGFCSNDLTAPVTRRHPIIAELVAALRSAGALVAEMTGSGSAVYGVFPESAGGIARTAALLAEEYPCTRWLSTRIVDVGKQGA